MAERLPEIRCPPALPVDPLPLAARATRSVRHERRGAETRPVRSIRTWKRSQRSEPNKATLGHGRRPTGVTAPVSLGDSLLSPCLEVGGCVASTMVTYATERDDGSDVADSAALGLRLFAGCMGALALGILLWFFGPRVLADNLSFVLVWGGFISACVVGWVFWRAWSAWDERRRPRPPGETLQKFE